MATRKYLYDARGRVARVIYCEDDKEKSFTTLTVENVAPLLEHVRERREALHSRPTSRPLTPVAEVPLTVYERAVREGWANDPAAWRRWLNDPDNRPFRIWGGRL